MATRIILLVATATAVTLRGIPPPVADPAYQYTFDNKVFTGIPFHQTPLPSTEQPSQGWSVDVGVQGAIPVFLNQLYARAEVTPEPTVTYEQSVLPGRLRVLNQGSGGEQTYLANFFLLHAATSSAQRAFAQVDAATLSPTGQHYWSQTKQEGACALLFGNQTRFSPTDAPSAAPSASSAGSDRNAAIAEELEKLLADAESGKISEAEAMAKAMAINEQHPEAVKAWTAYMELQIKLLAGCLFKADTNKEVQNVGVLTLPEQHSLISPLISVEAPLIGSVVTGGRDSVDKLPLNWFLKDDMFEWQRLIGSDAIWLRRAALSDFDTKKNMPHDAFRKILTEPGNSKLFSGMSISESLRRLNLETGSPQDNKHGRTLRQRYRRNSRHRKPKTASTGHSQHGDVHDDFRSLLAAGRILISDYSVFEGMPLQPPRNASSGNNGDQKYLYPARGLFVAAPDSKLRALAVQCGDIQGTLEDGGRIFTPPNPSRRDWNHGVTNSQQPLSQEERIAVTEWAMAKTCLQVAEQSHFEVVTHLAHTHLVAEVFSVAAGRTLPANHPIRRLLAAHLEGTEFINQLAFEKLMNVGGGIDQMFPLDIGKTQQIATAAVDRVLSDFSSQRYDRLLKANDLPEDLEVPFRDDGLPLWQATRRWVRSYVQTTYICDSGVVTDQYLQSFVAELTAADAGRVNGLCKEHGRQTNRVRTRDCLEQMLSQLVWLGSAGHAMTNFPQNRFTAYAPLAPVAGFHRGPDFAAEDELADGSAWIKMIPRRLTAILQSKFGFLLGGVHHTNIGNYARSGSRIGLIDIEQHKDALNKYQTELEKLGAEIDQRNAPCYSSESGCKETRRNTLLAYNELHPRMVPLSTNI